MAEPYRPGAARFAEQSCAASAAGEPAVRVAWPPLVEPELECLGLWLQAALLVQKSLAALLLALSAAPRAHAEVRRPQAAQPRLAAELQAVAEP